MALTTERLLKESRIAEAIALRHQHAAAIKALFDADVKALALAEQRGTLIRLEVAEAMIVSALQEPVIMLRQLPNLGRDPAEREKLTGFMNGVLDEFYGAVSAGPEQEPGSAGGMALKNS